MNLSILAAVLVNLFHSSLILGTIDTPKALKILNLFITKGKKTCHLLT